ncbi:MAG: MFS transporter [Alphaproteobacteria bacterium]|nr:MFS transporter [Rickettsiales bacterium]
MAIFAKKAKKNFFSFFVNRGKADKWFYMSIIFAEIMVYFSNDMYLGGVVSMQNDLGITNEQVSAIMTSWFVGASAFQFFIGGVYRFVKKLHLLVFGMVLFTISCFCCICIDSFYGIMFFRFLQGSGIGFIVTVGYSIVHESYSGKAVIKILSIMSTFAIVGPAFGPVFGSGISYFSNWRFIFVTLGIGGLISTIAIYKTTPYENLKNIKKISTLQVVKDYILILKNKDFVILTMVYCFRFASVLLWILAGPFLIVSTAGKTELEFGLVQLITCLGFPIGTIALNKMLKYNFSIKKIIKIGIGVHLISSILIVFQSINNYGGLPAFIAILIVSIAGVNLSNGSLNRLAIEVVPNIVSQASALLSSAVGLVGILCGILVLAITRFGFIGFSLIMLAMSVISMVFYTFIKHTELKK